MVRLLDDGWFRCIVERQRRFSTGRRGKKNSLGPVELTNAGSTKA